MAIHESVIIENGAKIADDVEIGPFCKIGKDVILESGCKLESNIILRGNLHIHADVKIFSFTTMEVKILPLVLEKILIYENLYKLALKKTKKLLLI